MTKQERERITTEIYVDTLIQCITILKRIEWNRDMVCDFCSGALGKHDGNCELKKLLEALK